MFHHLLRLFASELGALTEASPRSRNVTAIGPKFKLLLSGTVLAGDLIGNSSNTWVRAKATTGTAIQARFIALEPGDSGDIIEVCENAVVSGFTAATIAVPIYLEEGSGVGGGYTETVPSTSGDVKTPIGFSLTATELYVNPSANIDAVV